MRTRILLPALSLLLTLAALLTGVGATGPSVVATVPVGDLPVDVAVNGDTNRIYVTHSGKLALSVIDGSANQVVDEVALDQTAWAIALNAATGRIYASFSGRPDEVYVKVIDAATKQILTTLPAGSWPIDIAVNTATDRVYVVNHFDGTVMVIDGATNQIAATVDVGSLPRKVAVDQTTNRIYVSSQNGLTIIDGSTSQVVDSITLDDYPWGVAVNPAAGRIYTANTFDDSVSVIDASSKAVVATVPVGSEPEELAVNPTTNHIIVSNGGSDDVTVIDGATNSVIATLPVGDYPMGVGVNPATNLVYVANQNDGTVSVISDPPSEGTPTPTPPAGATPFTLATGWNQVCYVGSEESIESALAPILDGVSAVYRLGSGGGYDRWFPDRPEVSTISTVSPYKPLLLLATEGSTWNQTPAGSPPASAGLVQGWNSVCYTGTPQAPADATSSIADGFSILYMLASSQTWSRYVPARPEVGNIDQLGQYDAVLILATGAGATWTFGP